MKKTLLLLFCLALTLSACGQPAMTAGEEVSPAVDVTTPSVPGAFEEPLPSFPPAGEMLEVDCGEYAPLEDDGSRRVTIWYAYADGTEATDTYDLSSTQAEKGGPTLTISREWATGAEAPPSLISSGLLMAAVFRETLSAPARSISRMSFTERMPPPTVSGMKQHAAVRRTTSAMVARPSEEAVISRKTSSSACWASYALAHSTGSPASLRLMKLVPLTTLPSVTSRHGMILLASTALSSHHRRQRKSLKYGLPRDAF